MNSYLLAANIVVWLGIGGFVAFAALRTARLEKRLRQLEILDNEH